MMARMSVALRALVVFGTVVGLAGAWAAEPAASQPSLATQSAAGSRPAGKIEPLSGEKGKPFAVVQRVSKAPQLDGVLDVGWGSPTLTGFFSEDNRRPVKSKVQTEVWLRYDDANLYIFARMLEPEMRNLLETCTERDGEVWRDDSFEFFLDPAGKADPAAYVQLMVNPLGTLADQKGSPEAGQGIFWDCKGTKVTAGKTKDAWAIEMAIPLASLGVKESVAGKHWGANFVRERKPGAAENSSWCNIGPDWHQPDQFGHIAFEP